MFHLSIALAAVGIFMLALSKGLSNDDIAAMLKLSVPRVKQLLNDLYSRLGVANRAEAIGMILREHMV